MIVTTYKALADQELHWDERAYPTLDAGVNRTGILQLWQMGKQQYASGRWEDNSVLSTFTGTSTKHKFPIVEVIVIR